MEASRRYDTRLGPVTLRPERPEDAPFLEALFRSHAIREFANSGIPAATVEPLIAMQYRASTATQRGLFPNAIYSIIEFGGEAVGRFIEEDEGDDVYYVDFAFLPDRQAKGLGTDFIIAVADEWARKGKASRVEVLYTNVNSFKLCANVGLVRYADLGNGYIGLRRPIPAKS
jgi:GNAT superfamily N-acetyltransferase